MAKVHAGSLTTITSRTVEVSDMGNLVEMQAVGGSRRRADRIYDGTKALGGWDLFEDVGGDVVVQHYGVGWDEAVSWVTSEKREG